MDLEAADHPALTISMPHWWTPIWAKQLSWLYINVGWLGRRSLVATNRTSVSLAIFSALLTWSSDYYHLLLITYTGQCVKILHLPIEWSVASWLLASTCFYWNRNIIHRCWGLAGVLNGTINYGQFNGFLNWTDFLLGFRLCTTCCSSADIKFHRKTHNVCCTYTDV